MVDLVERQLSSDYGSINDLNSLSFHRLNRRCAVLDGFVQSGLDGAAGIEGAIRGDHNTITNRWLNEGDRFLRFIKQGVIAVEQGEDIGPGLESCNEKRIVEVLLGFKDPKKDKPLLHDTVITLGTGEQLIMVLRQQKAFDPDQAEAILKFMSQKAIALQQVIDDATQEALRSITQK